MFAIAIRRLQAVDWFLFTPMAFLIAIGTIEIYGISINPTAPNPSIFSRQAIIAALAVALFFGCSTINYRVWNIYSKIAYILGALTLVYVLFFGVEIRRTTGWISLGFTGFQPVEFAKIVLIMFLAKYFSDHARLFFLWRHTLVSAGATLLYVFLVLRQPDLGSAIVLCATWLLMMIIVGIPRRHLLTIIGVFVIAAVVSWFFVLQPYQKDRIRTFVNPAADALGVGYNVRQSIIATGSGMIFGRGFALGTQSQLKFLPEPETDFIFAVIAEEFGMLGSMLTIAGLFLILYRLLHIARRTADNFAAYFSLGIASVIIVQSFINIGMNIGIAPVVGIPLPFVSSGGSSLISLSIGMGIVSGIVSDQRTLAHDA